MSEGVARYRATVAYDGTDYFGFQRQAGDTPTIQGTIEAALETVTRQRVTLTGAGRTDTGVHAVGQVIAFEVAWRHTAHDLLRALNANLPESIALRALDEAPAAFHPRFDARSRAYEYTLYHSPVRDPLLRRRAWHIQSAQPLLLDRMQRCAEALIGTHDFASFGQPPQGENTVREVFRSAFTVVDAPDPASTLLRYEIEANAFLYRMVRRIVGALVHVGHGGLSENDFTMAFRAANSTWPNQSAPAHGLCLTRVRY